MSGAAAGKFARTRPEDTKVVIFVNLKFSLWQPPEEFAERLRRRWPEMRVVRVSGSQELAAELPDADVFVGFSLRPQQLKLARRLKWFQCTSAGVAQMFYPEFLDSGILLTNASGVHAIPMAEHVIGMILALLRDFPGSLRYQGQHRWAQQEIWDGKSRPRELFGSTALIIGFGAIGRAIAERLRGWAVQVWAVTRSGSADPALAKRAFPVAQLDSALPNADVIVLAAPETPETYQMIGARQIALMKRNAIFVNIARGSLVDEPALITALETRAIAGAGLDVTSEEPLRPENRLWSLENVIITPHISGITERHWEREADLTIDNLERWFSGKPLRNQVDPAKGY